MVKRAKITKRKVSEIYADIGEQMVRKTSARRLQQFRAFAKIEALLELDKYEYCCEAEVLIALSAAILKDHKRQRL